MAGLVGPTGDVHAAFRRQNDTAEVSYTATVRATQGANESLLLANKKGAPLFAKTLSGFDLRSRGALLPSHRAEVAQDPAQ